MSEASKADLQVPTTTARVSSATAAHKAIAVAKKADATRPAVDGAPRLVVWAAGAEPVLAGKSAVGGTQDDGTPSELHVITDATSGKALFDFQAVRTGTGTGQYSGSVPLSTTPSGSTYQLVDGDRAGHRTYDLNQGTSGTGTLFTDDNDVWETAPRATRRRPAWTWPSAPRPPGTTTRTSAATASATTAWPPTAGRTTATATSTPSGPSTPASA